MLTDSIGWPGCLPTTTLAAFIVIPGFANDNVGLSLTGSFGTLDGFQWLVLVLGIVILVVVKPF